jgi:colicin import membrane protein
MSDGRPKTHLSDADFARELVVASRAERPREGAKGRALAAIAGRGALTSSEVSGRRRAATIATALAGFSLAAGVLVGGTLLHRQREASLEAARAQATTAQQLQLHQLEARLREQQDRVENLQAKVRMAEDDAERAATARALAEAMESMAEAKRAVSTASQSDRSAAKPRPGKPACNCAPGDPLCSCIP